jgi:deoxyribose-phosphate aldolase
LGRELRATRAAAGAATWKAIVETGALAPAELITTAAAAIDAGVDFLKTSTGKGPPGATAEAVASLGSIVANAGRPVGIKVSGGVRAAADARTFLEIVRERLGPDWLRPERFRIGASSLLDALVP